MYDLNTKTGLVDFLSDAIDRASDGRQLSKETKKVRINLSALTRLYWDVEIDVPNNLSRSELDDLVREFYDEVDGSDFVEDNEYWERGNCYWEKI